MRERKSVDGITPEKAIALLKKEGIDVSIKEAELIVEMLQFFADIIVNQYLRTND